MPSAPGAGSAPGGYSASQPSHVIPQPRSPSAGPVHGLQVMAHASPAGHVSHVIPHCGQMSGKGSSKCIPQVAHSRFASTATTRASTARASQACSRYSTRLPTGIVLPSRAAREMSTVYVTGSSASWSSSRTSPYWLTTTNCAVMSSARRRRISPTTAESFALPATPRDLASAWNCRRTLGRRANASRRGSFLSRGGRASGAAQPSRSSSECARSVEPSVSVAEPTAPASSVAASRWRWGSTSLKQSPGTAAATQTPQRSAPEAARCLTQPMQNEWWHGNTTALRFGRRHTAQSPRRPSRAAPRNSASAPSAFVPVASASRRSTASARATSREMRWSRSADAAATGAASSPCAAFHSDSRTAGDPAKDAARCNALTRCAFSRDAPKSSRRRHT
mmetsp:Transcript_2484/g.8341  ORF Transcript_2484/g.8341 Transcript_2484/m.8341 type:complete len:393 (+) Transcript_2484:2028-3206(+)